MGYRYKVAAESFSWLEITQIELSSAFLTKMLDANLQVMATISEAMNVFPG